MASHPAPRLAVLGTGADDAALGSAQRSTRLVRIPPDLAADLALLTDALDLPATDLAVTMAALMSEAAAAVSSYVGLSVRVCSAHSHLELTTLEDGQIASVATSVRVPLPAEPPSPLEDRERVVLILYASQPGALIDLAADLAWLTGRPLDEFRLDADITGGVHLHPAESLRSHSAINQAIGVLIGQGRTSDQALAELDVRATQAGVPRSEAATALLASLPATALPDRG